MHFNHKGKGSSLHRTGRGGGKVYIDRKYWPKSKYTPAGPARNCGDRGINPKSFDRRQAAVIARRQQRRS